MSARFLAIVNPAAGGGRCGRLAAPALANLRSAGIELDVVETRAAGDATKIVREALRKNQRHFLAVGGDGTSFEIVNGIFSAPQEKNDERCGLAFLPLGTGNSFLRDFRDGAPPNPASRNPAPGNPTEAALRAIQNGRARACDVIRLRHSSGELYYINLLNLGFAADAAEFANRHLKSLGYTGYALSVMACLARLDLRAFPMRTQSSAEFDRRPCLFLAFSNTKFTGGNMLIAPNADAFDGLIEYVRWGPIGRIGLLKNFPALFDGSHIHHPLASRAAVKEVEFALEEPVSVTMDGESLRLKCERLDVLPGALDVLV